MTTARLRRLRHEQDGLSAGAETLVLGVLVFVVGTLIAVNAWVFVDSEMAANAAAREGARSLAESPADTWAEALDRARTVAADTLDAYGHDGAAAVVELVDDPDGGPATLDLTRAPTRCTRVTLRVTYPVARVAVPLVGWAGARVATGVHSELVDPLRGGLDGAADCV